MWCQPLEGSTVWPRGVELEPVCVSDGDALSEQRLWAMQAPCSEGKHTANTSGSWFCCMRPSAPCCQLQHWGISGATSGPTGELPQGASPGGYVPCVLCCQPHRNLGMCLECQSSYLSLPLEYPFQGLVFLCPYWSVARFGVEKHESRVFFSASLKE